MTLTKTAKQASLAFINTWLDTYFKYSDLPGFAVAIRDRNGLIFNRRWGMANTEVNEPMSLSHRFRFASHSKMFAAVAISLLAERGLLDLDDKAGKHLPWLRPNRSLSRVTIRQLLSHTSRILRDGLDAKYWAGDEFPNREEFRKQTLHMRVTPTRVAFTKYSNWGYALIGEIVEAVSGLGYSDFVARNILAPLRMDQTRADADPSDRLAMGYSARINGAMQRYKSYTQANAMAPAMGIVSTPEDMGHFLHAVFDGNLLQPSSKKQPMSSLTSMQSNKHTSIYGERNKYGLGFEWFPIKTYAAYGHCGSFPGFASDSYYLPHLGISVSLCATTNGIEDVRTGILRTFLFFEDLQKKRQLHLINGKNNPTGYYKHRCSEVFCLAAGQKLWAVHLKVCDPWDQPDKAKRSDLRTYSITDGDNDTVGETVLFDDKGHMVFAGHSYDLVSPGL